MQTPDEVAQQEEQPSKAKKFLKKVVEKEKQIGTFGKKIGKKILFSKDKKSKPKKIFGTRPVFQDYTREQRIMRSMFGHGEKVIFNDSGERHPPQINHVLNSGDGLLKSGDTTRQTMGMFGGSQSVGHMFGKRRRRK